MPRNRRGKGEGSIYQRCDGTWCATYSSGYDSRGRRKRRTIFGDSKEAVHKKLQTTLQQAATAIAIEPGRLKLSDFLDRWLKDAAQSTVRRTTFANYSAVVKNHINPQLGGVTLGNLSPIHVQSLVGAMQAKGKSAETIRLAYAVLRRALRQAVSWRLVAHNACYGVDRPRVAKVEIKTLDAAQVGSLLKAAQGDRFEALFVMAVATGMRLGELFGLQWSDVDLPAAAVMVRRTLSEVNGEVFASEPKTAKGRRRIDLPQIAVRALWKHKAAMLAEGFAAVEWVFCNSSGGMLRRTHFQSAHFKPLLKKAKLPDIRFHDLRHTSATLLLGAGVHPKVVQERLGHSQISVTLDTYSHILPTMQLEAASRLDDVLRQTAPQRKAK